MVDETAQNYRKATLRLPDRWSVGAFLIAALVLLPILSVVWIAFHPTENIWGHLIQTTLPRYLRNSVILMLATGLLTAAIGTGAAWLVVMTRFPGRRVLEIALLLPLALPAYIAAYALVDFWEYAGPLQSWLRGLFGWQSARDYWFPEPRSMWAAIFVLSLAMYPYTYLLTRAAFREQSANMLEVARALGCGPWALFWRVALPLARPAIAAGTAIVMMETVNDFGTVDFFGVQTLTTGIFTVWLEAGNAGGAAQIACVILSMVLLLAGLEKYNRRKKRFHSLSTRAVPVSPTQLTGTKAWAATLACLLPILFGFIIPFSIIAGHAMDEWSQWLEPKLWRAILNTLMLAGSAAILTILGALFLVYGARQSRGKALRVLMPVTSIGYAAPGAVLAIGILFPLAAFDTAVADFIEVTTGFDPGLLLTGTAAAVVIAYSVRFFAIGLGAVESAMGRVTPSMDMASRSLGRTLGQTLREVHVPLIRGSVVVAAMLIFVDGVKELPATLILRPFNFDTLAVRVYHEASLEHLERAAPAAILVTLVGLLPVLILAKTGKR